MPSLYDILDLIDRCPNHFSAVLIIGYVLGAICNWLFMKVAKIISETKHN